MARSSLAIVSGCLRDSEGRFVEPVQESFRCLLSLEDQAAREKTRAAGSVAWRANSDRVVVSRAVRNSVSVGGGAV